jgi:outer membrane biosynthesis protein TonB
MEPTLINLVLKLNCSELAAYEDQMTITARELNQLQKIAAIANQMVAKAEAAMAAAAAKAVEPVKAPAKKAAAKADTKASKKAAPKAAKAPKAAAKEVAPKATKVPKAPKAPKAPKPAAPKKAAAKRTRRTGDELVAFRAMLADQRNSGVPVAALSKQHGVSAAYIYQL